MLRWLFDFKRRNPGQVWAWATYDFANSAYATSIGAVIYNAYYAGVVAGGAEGVQVLGRQIPGASLFSWWVSLSMICVAVASPLLAAISDQGGLKKRMLGIHLALGVGATAALYSVSKGEWLWGGLLFLLGQFAFAGGNIFYNAMMHNIVAPEDFGKVSGIGWAWGYLGGGLLLALNLAMLQAPQVLGLPAGFFTVNDCFLTVALWWLLFSLPILRLEFAENARGSVLSWRDQTRRGWQDLRQVLRHFRALPNFSRFFWAYLFYNDGIETVLVMASIFGSQELQMDSSQLILFFLMIQGVALIGSLLCGWLADKFGNLPTIVTTLIGWVIVVVWAWQIGIFGNALQEFWLMGVLAALVMGGSQAASRSLQAELIPAERSSEFFSFFGISGRFGSAVGPLIFGAAVFLTGSVKLGVLSLLVFFVIGLLLLVRVDVSEGRAQARAFSAAQT